MILVNGDIASSIPVTDRGLQYGDGLFETIAIQGGKPLFLNEHIERLFASCQRLLIQKPSINQLLDDTHKLCSTINHETYPENRAVLKIIITRGTGGRGYRLPDNTKPTRICSLHPFPHYPESYYQSGVRLRICQTRLGINPALAGIKHLNRLEQILARAEWQEPDIQEGIMLDSNDNVIEGTMTNLFFWQQGQLYTPILTECGVSGVMRSIIMRLAQASEIPVVESVFDKKTLLAADEVFVTNSIIGLWPVRQIDNLRFADGAYTQSLLAKLELLKKGSV